MISSMHLKELWMLRDGMINSLQPIKKLINGLLNWNICHNDLKLDNRKKSSLIASKHRSLVQNKSIEKFYHMCIIKFSP